MSKPVVVLLDPHGPEVRAVIEAECPADLALRMTASADPAARQSLVGDAEFFVGGIVPIPEKAPGLVLAPHVAGSVFDNVGNVARHVFANIRRVLDGEPLPARDLVSP